MPRQWLLFLSARLLQSVSHRISPPKFLGFHLNSLFSLANLPDIFSCQLKHFNILPGKDNFCYLESFAVQDNATSVKITTTTTTIIKASRLSLSCQAHPVQGTPPSYKHSHPAQMFWRKGAARGCVLWLVQWIRIPRVQARIARSWPVHPQHTYKKINLRHQGFYRSMP